MTHETLTAVAQDLHLADVAGLYAAVGDSHVSPQNVIEHLEALVGTPQTDEDEVEEEILTQPSRATGRVSDSGVMVQGATDVMAKLARCCTPVPPDPITGYVTRGSGVTVHRADCPNITNLTGTEAERRVEVSWAPTAKSVFTVEIQVEALDRAALLSDVTRVLSENHVNILSASVSTTRERTALSRFSFEMADPRFLGHILSAVRKVDGVYDVYRTVAGQRKA
jgi:GTP pyrophosphokinase